MLELTAIREVLASYRSTTAHVTEDQIVSAWTEYDTLRDHLGDPERLAQRFHETYERLAPDFGYRTREVSAVAWKDVPAPNRLLMIATCAEVFG